MADQDRTALVESALTLVEVLEALREFRLARKEVEAQKSEALAELKEELAELAAPFDSELTELAETEKFLVERFEKLYRALTEARRQALLNRELAEELPKVEGVTIRIDTVPLIVNADEIPRSFLAPDLKSIRAHRGEDIGGIEWLEKPIPVIKK